MILPRKDQPNKFIMEGLNLNCLSLILEYLDARQCSQLRACNRIMYEKVNRIPNAVQKIRSRIVVVDDMEEFKAVLTRGHKLKKYVDFHQWFATILWYVFGVNFIDCPVIYNWSSLRYVTYGEGSRFYLDTETNDLIFASNSYYHQLNHCESVEHDTITQTFTYTHYECGKAEHAASGMEIWEKHFPGLIKSWMSMHFPFQPKQYYYLFPDDHGFHRGVCTYVRFNSFGIEGFPKDIFKHLEKMEKYKPKTYMEIGRGKKRRTIDMPTPPDHPFITDGKKEEKHGPVIETGGRKFMKHYKTL